ncbi:MAG: iron-sulfur cluster assembly scaffold protein [Pseudomonadota bacterium]
MSDQSLISLYSEKLLGLAAGLDLTNPLSLPDAQVKRRSPLCGSVVTVEIAILEERISQFHQDVKACALGQASAAVFGRHAIGLSYPEVKILRDSVSLMLTKNGPSPAAPFEDLGYLEAARDFKNRHDSIMLVFEATLEAFEQAQKKVSA